MLEHKGYVGKIAYDDLAEVLYATVINSGSNTPDRRRDLGQIPHHSSTTCGCSSTGRAPLLHGGGQGFESPQLHQGLLAMSIEVTATPKSRG